MSFASPRWSEEQPVGRESAAIQSALVLLKSSILMTRFESVQAAKVAGKKASSLITTEQFRELYAGLLQCRLLDERLGAHAGFERWPGREAASAGVTACLHRGDTITPTARGVLAGYLRNRSLALAQDTLEPRAELAATASEALRHKLERRGNIAVVYGGWTEPELTRQTFAAAAKQSLPAIFILERVAELSEFCGPVPAIRVDGSDTVAVYRVAYEAITRAREGGGPTILECAAWPFEAEASDPLLKLERYLAGKKLFSKAWKRRLEEKHAEEADKAVNAAENAFQIHKTAHADPQSAIYTRERNAVA